MRTLVIMRGVPGCGKSTWIREQGYEKYAVSSDAIRILYHHPYMDAEGNECVYDGSAKRVWATVYDILEAKMKNGEFTIMDSTNTSAKEINKLRELAKKYRYRMFCVDFSKLPVIEAIKRNESRTGISKVPNEVIERMQKRLEDNLYLPLDITVIDPEEGAKKLLMTPIDLSLYKRINIIGDIHGCFSVLKKYLNGELKEDEFYIFLGDYLDRGLENAKTLKLLLSIYDRNNVMLLEGNHERWIKRWAKDEDTASKEFNTVTKPELDTAGIDKKEVRKLCSKLCQCAYFTFNDMTFFCCHGGISNIPFDKANNSLNPTLIPTELLIHGTGGYEDTIKTETAFDENIRWKVYQVHGHRNLEASPIIASESCFNLEGAVERGKYLRAIELFLEEGEVNVKTVEMKNDVYKDNGNGIETVAEAVEAFRNDRYIKEKRFGDISSFNFSRDAFYNRVWTDRTVKARGLYINTKKNEIVARGYDKFFNVGEMPETELETLKSKLVFPVSVYFKENGFLGLLSYNKDTDDLFFTTKSDPTGPYTERFKTIFNEEFPERRKRFLIDFLQDNNVTMVFECIDTEYDPHIIKYPNNRIVLLDIIHNTLNTKKINFDELIGVAKTFGFERKQRFCILSTHQDFTSWYNKAIAPGFMENTPVEGFVLEDSTGYMVKVKTDYYMRWKRLRSLLHKVYAGTLTDADMQKTDDEGREFLNFAVSYHNRFPEDEKSIIDMRDLFFKTKEN